MVAVVSLQHPAREESVAYYNASCGVFSLVIQEIPAFRDFTIRDPRYFVIIFQAKFHDFKEKNPKKKIFFGKIFFWNFFFKIMN